MSISNGIFKGEVEGNSVASYSNRLDYSIDDLIVRKELVKQTLNLDDIGSNDKFWIDIWDMANCKVSLNKDDSLWTDTNVAKLLESMGTYLLAADENEEKRRFNRPKKEVKMNDEFSSEDFNEIKNEKNYRLSPSDEIKSCDFRMREVFSKDYNYYKNVLFVKYIDRLKTKISNDLCNRYGYHDGTFDNFSHAELMSEEKWSNLKRLEEQKINLLKDAKHNLDALKGQLKMIQEGTLYFHESKTISIYKHDFMNRITPCHIQLKRYGLDNSKLKGIEEKCLYKIRVRSRGVGLRHITENLSDVKDYMLKCKLAYTNRVYIDAGKNSVNTDILDQVDYTNRDHVEAILYLQGCEISYENDMSIISYDVTKAIKDLKKLKKLDDKDMHIIEGIRHKMTQESIANELSMNRRSVMRRIDKIVDKIKSFW